MKISLKNDISLLESEAALKGMDPSKAPSLDGVVTTFFKIYWDVIKIDYWRMITLPVQSQHMPSSLTSGVITLLYKGGEREHLSNWCLITLFSVAYKIYAKALQLRLQPILMEIISFV